MLSSSSRETSPREPDRRHDMTTERQDVDVSRQPVERAETSKDISESLADVFALVSPTERKRPAPTRTMAGSLSTDLSD
jgi:hypothetical protein